MRKTYPQAHRRTCRRTRCPPRSRSRRRTPTTLKAISADLRAQKFAGVETVKDGQQLSKRILSVARVIELVFLIAVIVLLGASVLLIANTIRLSIFSRRREIEVMKLVGATNWFVRGPFMLEGLLCGLGGAIAAVVLLILGKEVVAAGDHPERLHLARRAGLSFSLIALIADGHRPRASERSAPA